LAELDNLHDTSNPSGSKQLTISEFEEIAQRTESSLKHLQMIKGWVENESSKEKQALKDLRDRVDRECEKMTVRVVVSRVQGEKESGTHPGVLTQIFKITLPDIGDHKAYMLLKHPAKRKIQCVSGQNYLVDKVKLVLNPKREMILVSTTLTVLRVEKEETFSLGSLELSQNEPCENFVPLGINKTKKPQQAAYDGNKHFVNKENNANNLVSP